MVPFGYSDRKRSDAWLIGAALLALVLFIRAACMATMPEPEPQLVCPPCDCSEEERAIADLEKALERSEIRREMASVLCDELVLNAQEDDNE